jgi:hypothetical protein
VYTYKINLRDDVQNKVHQYIGMVVLLKLEY